MASVNTNVGAYVALQNLNATNKQLEVTQSRINTGLKVASAKDNGGIYAIAQNLRGDLGSYNAVSQSLDRAKSAVDVALSAGESVSDLLVELKQKAVSAADASLDTASRDALNEDFTALRDQIATIVSNATFNGVNLLDGSVTDIQAIANADASSHITVAAESFSFGGSVISLTASQDISTQGNASVTLATITSDLQSVNEALARLGTGAKKLELHQTFVSKLSDTIKAGIGNLVDADLAAESATLQALQVKQQLGIQALSIANQSPQTLLSLFR